MKGQHEGDDFSVSRTIGIDKFIELYTKRKKVAIYSLAYVLGDNKNSFHHKFKNCKLCNFWCVINNDILK